MKMRIAVAALGLCTPALLCTTVLAHDNGQFKDVPENVRSWFKSVKNPQGIPCRDIADGHRTDYDIRGNKYWVPINGQWMAVPDEAVLKDFGNPVGDAVVWYSVFSDTIYIRCFVPGGGA